MATGRYGFKRWKIHAIGARIIYRGGNPNNLSPNILGCQLRKVLVELVNGSTGKIDDSSINRNEVFVVGMKILKAAVGSRVKKVRM